jgi:hypothetical protein
MRRASMPLNIVVGAAILILVFIIVSTTFGRGWGKTSSQMGGFLDLLDAKACEAKLQFNPSETVCGSLPLSCTPCLGASNFEDFDGDKIPDACDVDAQDPKVAKCKAWYSYSQCCISENPCPTDIRRLIKCQQNRPPKG